MMTCPSFPSFDEAQDRLRRESSFLPLDSGSRPSALPGMTGCHECPAQVEDFVSEQQRLSGAKQSPGKAKIASPLLLLSKTRVSLNLIPPVKNLAAPGTLDPSLAHA